MRRFTLILLIFCAHTVFAQRPDGVGIHYNLILLENKYTRDLEYEYIPGTASLFTPLYPPEMEVLQKAFLKHIETMRRVKNYVGPVGTASPTSLGDRGFQEAIMKIKNGKLERIGRMYMEVAQYEDYWSYKNDTIYLNDEPRIAGNLMLFGKDTVFTENIITGEMNQRIVDHTGDYVNECVGASFIEEWDFDHRKGALEKTVRYISLNRAWINPTDESFLGTKNFMTLKGGNFNRRNIRNESLIRKNMEYNVLFNRDFSREDEDIAYYGMARSSDAFGYIEPIERIQFLVSILHNVKNGSLEVYEYDPLNFDIENMKKVHPISWFDDVEFQDTVLTENLETGAMDTVIVEGEYQLEDVVGIRFFEDWYIDAQNMALYKRVNGIVILMEKLDDETGEPKGVTPISKYFIKLNPLY